MQWTIDNRLQVFLVQPRFLGDLREKAWANFVAVVEGKRIIGPARSFETTMRPVLPRHRPSDSDQCRQELFRLQ